MACIGVIIDVDEIEIVRTFQIVMNAKDKNIGVKSGREVGK